VLKEPLRVEINVDEGGADLIGERGAEGSGIEAVLRVLAEEADRLEAVLKTAKRGELKRIVKGKDGDGMLRGDGPIGDVSNSKAVEGADVRGAQRSGLELVRAVDRVDELRYACNRSRQGRGE
jgi:hypothetical protein